MRKFALFLAIIIPLACLTALIVYNLPPVHERLAWRFEVIWSDIKYALDPPEKVVFTPGETAAPTHTPLPLPSLTPTIIIATPQPTSTPLPALMLLLDFWPLKRLKRQSFFEKIPFYLYLFGPHSFSRPDNHRMFIREHCQTPGSNQHFTHGVYR